jgi:hypothetical protein
MADRVIIVGANRRNEQIPIGELKQMIGRAGRGHELGTCHADIIVEESDAEYVTEGIDSKANLTVHSVLNDRANLEFHVLPEICCGNITDIETAEEWHQRSFHAQCGGAADWEKVLTSLREAGAICWDGERLAATSLGEIASSYYFHAADVKAWRDNFTKVFDMSLEDDDIAVAWALGNVERHRRSGSFGKNWEVLEDCRNRLPAGLTMNKGCMITTTLWWHVFGGPPVGKLKNQAIELKEDFGRIHRVLTVIDDRIAKWGMSDFIDTLLERSRKAIPSEMADLMKEPGMTKGKAVALNEMGIGDRKELSRAKRTMDLSDVLGEGYDFS